MNIYELLMFFIYPFFALIIFLKWYIDRKNYINQMKIDNKIKDHNKKQAACNLYIKRKDSDN